VFELARRTHSMESASKIRLMARPNATLIMSIRSLFFSFGLLIISTLAVQAQEVVRISWPTRNAAAPPTGADAVVFMPVARASAARLTEAEVVSLALRQSAVLGMTEAEAARLNKLVARRYELVAASPVFKGVPSALKYCFAETRPTEGLAWVYRPAKTAAQTPVIVFVHGYGGLFLWYPHQLAEWFPGHIIVCPAYGIDPSAMPATYLSECLAAVATKLDHALAKPVLIGLSAGGFGATRIYAANASRYRGLIVMAAYPPDDAFRRWPKTASVGFLVGEREDYVKDGGFADYSRSLAARSAFYEGAVIAKADQFFLLTHPTETRLRLQAWMK
jgi:Alpha/beta hydrolase family